MRHTAACLCRTGASATAVRAHARTVFARSLLCPSGPCCALTATHTHPPASQARACLSWELLTRKYSPIQSVARVACPVLYVAAKRDELCPVDQVYKAGKLTPRGQLLMRDCTHFELYRGALFEGLIAEQLAFLQKHTGLRPA